MALLVVQIVSAIGIVGAFAALQAGWVDRRDLGYLVTNLVSGSGLAVCALVLGQPGFVLTNGVWAVVAGAGLVARRRAASRPRG